ncbi:MAG TPA: hypothetical protein PK402_08255 [Tepidisphaeraceae bacterium]|nr:hypothetical protein [Tepidisphaeraceae bacterium]
MKDRPSKTRPVIAIALILLLGASATATVWWMNGGGEPKLADTQPDPGSFGRFGGAGNERARRNAMEQGVNRLPARTFVVMIDESRLDVRRENNRWEIRFTPSAPLMTVETRRTLQRRQAIINEPNIAKQLSVSEDQVQQLNKLEPAPPTISEADEDAIAKLIEQLETTTNDTDQSRKLESDLMEIARRIASSDFEPIRQSHINRAEQVQKILTPEQLSAPIARQN